MPKPLDYLIIGQGLAGSLLSWELIKQGCRILLIDNAQENASQIAAGLINPVTGLRLVKSSEVDTLLPSAKKTYQALEHFFQQTFYIEKAMQRIVRNEKEILKFHQRVQDSHYQPYLDSTIQVAPELINAPLGLIQQKQTGYLLTQPLLTCLKQFLQAQQSYQAQQFDYQDLEFNETVRWQNISAKKIIFCEGYQAIHNPWFKYLPFQLAKGEILTLTSEQALPECMLNYGRWFIPLNKHQFRTGATFDNHTLDTSSSLEGKQLLLAALKQVIPSLDAATLIKQQANIRPTTLDKQPFIGQHPEHKALYIFNGFGAKGSLQIPYYSQQFARYLLQKTALDIKVNCQRYVVK